MARNARRPHFLGCGLLENVSDLFIQRCRRTRRDPSSSNERRRKVARSWVRLSVMTSPYSAMAGDVKASEAGNAAVQVVFVGALDFRGDDFTGSKRTAARQIHRAIDLRRVRLRASLRDGRADFVDDDPLPGADLALEPARGNFLLPRHQRIPTLLFCLVGHGMTECVRSSARDRLVFEAAEAIDLGLFH